MQGYLAKKMAGAFIGTAGPMVVATQLPLKIAHFPVFFASRRSRPTHTTTFFPAKVIYADGHCDQLKGLRIFHSDLHGTSPPLFIWLALVA